MYGKIKDWPILAEGSDENQNKISETEEMRVRGGNIWVMTKVRTHIGRHAPEKIKETKHLHQHADYWPLGKNEKDTPEDADSA